MKYVQHFTIYPYTRVLLLYSKTFNLKYYGSFLFKFNTPHYDDCMIILVSINSTYKHNKIIDRKKCIQKI